MTTREVGAYSIALLALAVGGLAVVKGDADSATTAAWVQALGSVAAIIVVSLPVLLQRGIELQQAKAATWATVFSAWQTMQAIAHRYMGQDNTSEWYVPQLQIIEEALARCPVDRVGSSDATTAFIHFRELFARSAAFEEPDEDQRLAGFVAYIMTNASRELDTLQRLLK